jgi:hypothetical protein
MAALKHDAQGFLVGDPIDIGRALAVWDDIRSDVRAIRKAVMGASEAAVKGGGKHADASRVITPRGGMEEADPAVKATPRGRERAASAIPARRYSDEIPSLLRKAVTPVRGQGNEAASTSAKSGASGVMVRPERKSPQSVAKPAGRDGRGRFTKGDGRPDGLLPNDAADDADTGALRSIADRIVGAVADSSGGMEEADPAVKAFNEVAQPMARGYEMLTGGSEDKKQTGFLRRIFSTLSVFRKEETAYSKAANKSLKLLEEKPEAKGSGDGGGLLGMMSGLLSKIPVIGPMLAGGAGMLGGASKGLMGAGKGLLGAGKGMLRRIPLLGALIGGVGAASDIYSSETDDSLTRRQKDEKAGKAVGGFAGSVGGMLAGAKLGAMAGAIGGPIGVAIGGALGGAVGMFFGDQAGQIIGDTVGGWVSDLREADIPGKIVGAWEATTDFLKKGWDGALEKLSDAWKGIKDAGSQAVDWAADKANAANSFVKDKTGFDAKAGAQRAATWAADTAVSAKTKAVEVGGQAVDSVKKGAEWAADNTTVGKGVAKAWEGAKTAGNWVLGQTSKLFESGKGGAGTVSSGKGDFGGASYGTYQLSSTQGTLQKFLKSSKYGDQFTGLQPGSPEFNAKWKEVAKADPEFGNAQHDFIKASHYDPQIDRLKKGGIDLSGRGAAVQDAVWSTSVQFGGNSSLIEKSLKGKDTASMSDADIVSAIQDYKVANNDKLFASSSAGVRAGTAKRAVEEKNRLLALAGQDAAPTAVASQQAPSSAIASPAPPVVASISAPPVSVAPTAPPIAEAPTVAVPMASADTKKAAAVAAPSQDAGQDLKDRRIAHIVTGGLSNA